MNKAKLAKIVVKTVLGFGVSAAIGYTIKGEKLAGVKIDNYFDSKSGSTGTN